MSPPAAAGGPPPGRPQGPPPEARPASPPPSSTTPASATTSAGREQAPRRRLVGVDAARGVALLGMVAVHVLPATGADGGVTAVHDLAGGRSAALFAVLAGVGLALAHRLPRGGGDAAPPGRPRRAAPGLVVRAVAIGAVGLALGTLDSGVAVILGYYAVLFVLAVPLLRRGPRALGAVAAVAALVVPVVSHAVREDLPTASYDNPTLAGLLERPAGSLQELLLTGYYPALPWVTYLAAGLAVGRLALGTARVQVALLGGGALLAGLATTASAVLLGPLGGAARLAEVADVAPADLDDRLELSLYGVTPPTSWWWLAVDAPHSSTPLDLLHTTGTSLAVLGGALLLARVAAPVLVPLAAAGSMTLTVYTVHVVALGAQVLPSDPATSYALQVVLALVLALLWRSAVGRGPLEGLVALLSRAADR